MWWLKKKERKVFVDSDRERFQQFYHSSEWRKLRLYVLAAYPLCQHCEREGLIEPAYHVDHIIPLAIDYSLLLTFDNCQSLCHRCHSIKTTTVDKQMKTNKQIQDSLDRLADFD